MIGAKSKWSARRTWFALWSKGARALASWLSRGGCEKQSCGGIELWNVPALNTNGKAFFDGTRQALDLIRETDALRWRRLVSSVRVITPISQRRLASYHHYLRMCMVNPKAIDLQTKDGLRWYAVVLAHEGCHAYLLGKGIPWNKKMHKRIESICVEDSIRFARKMAPERSDWVQHLRGAIRQYLSRHR